MSVSKRIRKKYSPQFKEQALARAEKEGIKQVSKDLGLDPAYLYSWRAKSRDTGIPLENQRLQQAELAKLKRDNARLMQENEFLKKVAVYFTKEKG